MSFVLKQHFRIHLDRRSLCRVRAAYSTARKGSHETTTIPVGTSGRIQLDIHHPPQAPPSRPRILLYLPSNPLFIAPKSSSTITANSLALTANATTITPHYRLSSLHQYPTPTHDVVAAYDWIVHNLVPRHGPAAEIAVTGSLVGGSLALALGLTECHADPGRARITAIAALDPIVDWVFESDAAFHPRFPDAGLRSKKQAISSTDTAEHTGLTPQAREQIAHLYRLRAAAFPAHRPARYFDPFPSPIHFLRSPTRTAPSSMPAPDPEGPLSAAEAEFEALTGLDLPASRKVMPPLSTGTGSTDEDLGIEEGGKVDGRRFRRALRWPPMGSGLLVPRTRLSASPESVLLAQIEEMVRLLKKAREREAGIGEQGTDEEEERAVQFCYDVLAEGEAGAVLGTEGTEHELRKRGEWLGEMLDA